MLLIYEPIKSVRGLIIIFLFLSSIILLSNCEKENSTPRSYPRLTTLAVTDVSSKGATFNADLYALGTETIIEYGFVWGIGEVSLSNSYRKLLGSCDKTGKFSVKLETGLEKDRKYVVKSFVQTTDHIVYGIPVEFISLGSDAPVILDFSPHTARWNDTLTITGKNFSLMAGDNVIKLNEITCPTLSSTEDCLKVLVAWEVAQIKSVMSVTLAGNTSVNTIDTFSLAIPVIEDFYPKQARWGDTITVLVKDIPRINVTISAAIGGYASTIIAKTVDYVKLLVPLNLNNVSNSVNFKIHNQNYLLSDKVNLLSPVINYISPKTGTWGSVVTLKGKFHPSSARNVITIGGISVPLISNNGDSIKIAIPQNLSSPLNVLLNTSAPFTVASQDTFRLLGPVIESISPLLGASGSSVTIKGKYLQDGNGSTTVRFGTQIATIEGHSSTQIDCKVPTSLSNGPVNISVAVASQSMTFPTPYDVKNPVITSIYPLNGSVGDAITIEGDNLLIGGTAPDVYFTSNSTETYASTVSALSNKIVVIVPPGVDSIPKKLKLNYRPLQFIYFNTEFKLNPPVITSITASVLIPGQDISILGTGFNPVAGNNQVFWGTYPLIVKNSTSTMIIATVPSNLPGGFKKISINVGGYKRVYPNLFESRSAWSEITVPNWLLWNSAIGISGGIGFSINNKGYMIDPTGNMNSFNPLTKEFVNLGFHQEFAKSQGFSKMILNDTLYATGFNVSQLDGLFRYDVELNSWIRLANVPGNSSNGVGFSLNGKLYYGLTIVADNYSLSKIFWVYNPSSKTWVAKNQFPAFSNSRAVAYFTILNRGYVLFKDRVFCEYNPDTDTWTKLASYPAIRTDLSSMVCFVMNNKGYVGLGGMYYNSVVYNDLWAFDPLTNSWVQSVVIPATGRYNAVSFVINNKAYIGFGAIGNSNLRDFYEYDPNFVAK